MVYCDTSVTHFVSVTNDVIVKLEEIKVCYITPIHEVVH